MHCSFTNMLECFFQCIMHCAIRICILQLETCLTKEKLPPFQETPRLWNAKIAWNKTAFCRRFDVFCKNKCCITIYVEHSFSERCSAAAFKGRLHYERHMHFVHETLPIKLCSSLKHAISFVAILDIERLLNIFKITARFKECCIFCSNTACFERILSILRVFKKYCTFCRSSWCPLNRILHWEK